MPSTLNPCAKIRCCMGGAHIWQKVVPGEKKCSRVPGQQKCSKCGCFKLNRLAVKNSYKKTRKVKK